MKNIGKILLIFPLLFSIFVIVGCGDTGDSIQKENVVGKNTAKKDELNVTNTDHKYANSHNLYTIYGDESVRQRSLDGTLIKEFEIQDLERLLLVNDEGIYYTRLSDDGNSVWEVPLKKNNLNDQILVEEKKKVFDIPQKETISEFYANGEYLLCITEKGNLWSYNLECCFAH